MEKSEINGEKFVRRSARAWRLRRFGASGTSDPDVTLPSCALYVSLGQYHSTVGLI